jgi:hypothetical protein
VGVDQDEPYRRQYPDAYKIVDNEIHKVTVNGLYYHHTPGFFTNANFRESVRTFDIVENKSICFQNIQWKQNKSNYCYGRDYYDSSRSIDLHIQLQTLAVVENYDYDNLLPSQYVELMTQLGYGTITCVLQNGKEIEYKELYYSWN